MRRTKNAIAPLGMNFSSVGFGGVILVVSMMLRFIELLFGQNYKVEGMENMIFVRVKYDIDRERINILQVPITDLFDFYDPKQRALA